MTAPRVGDSDDRPSRRPTASEDVITELAPDCFIKGAFSCSRTEATIQASALSWRTVSVARTLESSRSVVMMICRASATPARCSTSERVASPVTTASPSAWASETAWLPLSTTTIRSRSMPLPTRVSTALRPLVP